jgi:hypothetical protein
MKNHVVSIVVVILLAVTLGLGPVATRSQGAADENPDRALTGTWLETITFAGVPPPIPLHQALESYTADGVLIIDSSLDLAGPSMTGTHHGAWVRTGHGSYRYTARAFPFNLSGVQLFIIDQDLTVSDKGDSYTGSGSLTGISANGSVVFSFPFTTVAQRIVP